MTVTAAKVNNVENVGKVQCQFTSTNENGKKTRGSSTDFPLRANYDLSQNALCAYPSEKYEFVSWDDEILNIWKQIKCSKPPTTHIYIHIHYITLLYFTLHYITYYRTNTCVYIYKHIT